MNIFASDIDRLADFYSRLLDLEEIVESRTPLYRGFRCGGASLGFSAMDAYEILALQRPEGQGERNVITFDVDDQAEVRRLVAAASSMGASILKEPFETYYGWYQAVLRDPEGNAFRLNFPGKAA
ncbi:VOC family protein [Methylorubrum populi]|uniref:VOC family protein n=1 Tax=Methylorubrum populi TaxID=223967 RepID=UPI001AEF5199|nr:VOC family protein [Methylorubrum populi]